MYIKRQDDEGSENDDHDMSINSQCIENNENDDQSPWKLPVSTPSESSI